MPKEEIATKAETAFHLSLRVADLPKAKDFYAKLFGIEPAKAYKDYVKFEVVSPSLVLSLEPIEQGAQPRLDHMGIRLSDRRALMAAATELAERGVESGHLNAVECCYARQSKVYMHDPDGRLFEIYIVDGDLEPKTAVGARTDAVEATAMAPSDSTFVHNIPAAWPKTLGEEKFSSILLRGTFNRRENADEIFSILRMAQSALHAGGTLAVHLLCANTPYVGEVPQLPEPANHVEHLPTEEEIVTAFEEIGFVGITVKRMSHGSVFTLGDVECREFLLEARAPTPTVEGANEEGTELVYKGPFPMVNDEEGNSYQRAVRKKVSSKVLRGLEHSGLLENFIVLNSSQGCQASVNVE